MMRRLALAVLLVVALGGLKTAAQTCSLATQPLNFGTYTGAMIKSTTTWQVTCNSGWTIPLYAGKGVGATETTRKMTLVGGTATLNYSIFKDGSYSANWGSTTNTDEGGTGSQQVIVYAELAAGQIVPPGTYTDTVNTATTTNFTLTAVIQANCTISAIDLIFGNYAGLLVNAISTITVNCTTLAPYNVGLGAGAATGATVTTRQMTGPASALMNYKLFRNSDHTGNWGNTVGTNTVAGTGNGGAQALNVYGQIPAGQSLRPGTYTDTIVATVTY